MGQRLSDIIYRSTASDLVFWCPACNTAHGVKVAGASAWGWNGSADRPTFTPSVLARGRRMTAKGRADHEAWVEAGCPKPAPESFDGEDYVCHSFVADGKIQFLGDCTHHLAGQTVPLADLPEWLGNN